MVKTFKKDINENKICQGVDLSSFQEQIDWNVLSSNIDFAILKAYEKNTKDSFNSQYESCKEFNIPVGAYTVVQQLLKK